MRVYNVKQKCNIIWLDFSMGVQLHPWICIILTCKPVNGSHEKVNNERCQNEWQKHRGPHTQSNFLLLTGNTAWMGINDSIIHLRCCCCAVLLCLVCAVSVLFSGHNVTSYERKLMRRVKTVDCVNLTVIVWISRSLRESHSCCVRVGSPAEVSFPNLCNCPHLCLRL